jgi:hypothetical protein
LNPYLFFFGFFPPRFALAGLPSKIPSKNLIEKFQSKNIPYIMSTPNKLTVKLKLKVPIEYRQLKDYPDYEISNYGEVRNIQRNTHLTPKSRYEGGNMYVFLSDGKQNRLRVSRLVATTFLPNPLNSPDIKHIDGCLTNNRVDNLCWTTFPKPIHKPYIMTRTQYEKQMLKENKPSMFAPGGHFAPLSPS